MSSNLMRQLQQMQFINFLTSESDALDYSQNLGAAEIARAYARIGEHLLLTELALQPVEGFPDPENEWYDALQTSGTVHQSELYVLLCSSSLCLRHLLYLQQTRTSLSSSDMTVLRQVVSLLANALFAQDTTFEQEAALLQYAAEERPLNMAEGTICPRQWYSMLETIQKLIAKDGIKEPRLEHPESLYHDLIELLSQEATRDPIQDGLAQLDIEGLPDAELLSEIIETRTRLHEFHKKKNELHKVLLSVSSTLNIHHAHAPKMTEQEKEREKKQLESIDWNVINGQIEEMTRHPFQSNLEFYEAAAITAGLLAILHQRTRTTGLQVSEVMTRCGIALQVLRNSEPSPEHAHWTAQLSRALTRLHEEIGKPRLPFLTTRDVIRKEANHFPGLMARQTFLISLSLLRERPHSGLQKISDALSRALSQPRTTLSQQTAVIYLARWAALNTPYEHGVGVPPMLTFALEQTGIPLGWGNTEETRKQKARRHREYVDFDMRQMPGRGMLSLHLRSDPTKAVDPLAQSAYLIARLLELNEAAAGSPAQTTWATDLRRVAYHHLYHLRQRRLRPNHTDEALGALLCPERPGHYLQAPAHDHHHDVPQDELHSIGLRVESGWRELLESQEQARQNAARAAEEDRQQAEQRSSVSNELRHSESVLKVRQALQGKTISMIGGIPYAKHWKALEEAFGVTLDWIDKDRYPHAEWASAHVQNGHTALVLIAIRWMGHAHSEIMEVARRENIPFVKLPGGLNPEQVAYHIIQQASIRLGIT